MSTVNEDIKQAMKVMDTNSLFIDRFDKIYPFATENVYGCFDNYNFEDKDCLTVLGSSAQMLYMYLNGAKNVTAFDINNLTIYYFYFIKAFLLSNISKEDFTNIFITRNSKEIKRVFSKILKHLKGDAYIFWKSLYNMYHSSLFNDWKLFHYPDRPTIYHTSGFLDDENIKIIRKKIINIDPKFIHCNLKDLSKYLQETFDLIYLSNIIQYTDSIHMYGAESQSKLETLIKYKKLLIDLSKYLKKDGLIYAGYIYEPNDYYQYEPLYNDNRKRIFSPPEFDCHYFKGYNDVEYEIKTGLKRNKLDACLIYSKK